METTHIMLEDMQVFGTIANLVQQGAVNIPIEKGIMTYDNEPVVCVLAFVSKICLHRILYHNRIHWRIRKWNVLTTII